MAGSADDGQSHALWLTSRKPQLKVQVETPGECRDSGIRSRLVPQSDPLSGVSRGHERTLLEEAPRETGAGRTVWGTEITVVASTRFPGGCPYTETTRLGDPENENAPRFSTAGMDVQKRQRQAAKALSNLTIGTEGCVTETWKIWKTGRMYG